MKNLKDEIEGIDEFVEYFLDGVDCLVNLDSMDYESEKMLRAGAKRELASLIEQEKEMAVMGFIDYMYGQNLPLHKAGVVTVRAFAKQYLAERNEQE